MKHSKSFFIGFLFCLFFQQTLLSQELIPDSLTELVQSEELIKQANGWQKTLEFHYQIGDTLNYNFASKQFRQLPLNKLNTGDYKKVVKTYSLFLKKSFQYNIAKNFLAKRIKESNKNNELENKAVLHQLMAPHYFHSFEYDSSHYHIDQALDLYETLGNNDEAGNLTINKSGIYYAKGDYEEALKWTFKALEIFKTAQNKGKLAMSYLQVGNIFYFLDDFDQSMQYYELALAGFESHDDTRGVNIALSNIGLVNLELKKYRTSINQQLRAIKYFNLNNSDIKAANSYLFLSEGYLGIEKYDSATYYNKLAIKANRKTKYAARVSEGFLIQSKIFQRKNYMEKALLAANKAYSIADSIQHFESLKSASEQLSNIYEALGRIDSSFHYLKIYNQFEDSLDLDPKVLKEYAKKHQYHIEQVEFELLLEKEKTAIQEQISSKKEQQLIVAILVASFALLLLILVSVFLYKNRTLSVKLANKQLEVERELRKKESLLNEIHHRVKNNLQVISSMLSLQTEYISDDRVQKVITDCKSRINSMSLIHESLYKKTDGIEAPFSEYIEVLVNQLIETYQVDRLKIKANMDLEKINLNLDESIPCGLLINEIVSNTLKHAFPKGTKGKISISLRKKGDFIHLQIADNGIGFESEDKVKKQDSFGFLLIDTLVLQLDAEMECTNENGVQYFIKWRSIS